MSLAASSGNDFGEMCWRWGALWEGFRIRKAQPGFASMRLVRLGAIRCWSAGRAMIGSRAKAGVRVRTNAGGRGGLGESAAQQPFARGEEVQRSAARDR